MNNTLIPKLNRNFPGAHGPAEFKDSFDQPLVIVELELSNAALGLGEEINPEGITAISMLERFRQLTIANVFPSLTGSTIGPLLLPVTLATGTVQLTNDLVAAFVERGQKFAVPVLTADCEAVSGLEHRPQQVDAFIDLHPAESVHVLHQEDRAAGVASVQEPIQSIRIAAGLPVLNAGLNVLSVFGVRSQPIFERLILPVELLVDR